MMQSTWLLAIPVVLLLLWLAWRRPNRQRLALRLLASAVAGISLVGLVFPPSVQHAISPGTAILLTEGYNPDTLKHLLNQVTAAPQVYSYHTAAKDATPLESLYLLRQKQPGLRQVHVLGYGLQEPELQALEGMQLRAHLPDMPTGITAVHWPENVVLGEAVEVAGRYKNEGDSKVKLFLQAAGQSRDSVEVVADSTARFTLAYTPKVAGKFTYALTSRTGEKTDTLGLVPVRVQPVQELGVLLLASSPLFEFRFLKNHLAGLQHRVALRITISKDLRQQEWLNMPRINLDRLTPALLQKFDVVVTEPEALQQLSGGERSALQRAVTDEGLGVLTITNNPTANRSTALFKDFQTKKLSQQDTRNTRASWAGKTAVPVVAAPYTLLPGAAITGFVTESQDRLLAGTTRAGWGTIALSLVPQTFAWKLEGQEEVYASYWANLLSAVARREVQEKFWQLASPQVPHPHQPLTLTLTDYTAASIPPTTVTSMADSTTVSLPLAQHPFQPAQFSGTFWPRRNGWYQVKAEGMPPYQFLVQDSTDWHFTTLQARRQATEAFLTRQSVAPVSDAAIAYEDKPISLLWFFALFVLSSGFLWLEEKF
ncbi:hypothetical protein ACXYMU_00050 [Pontibacter sp. CAU 1760]